MQAPKQTLLEAAREAADVGDSFEEALAAEPEWPALSAEEAAVFMEGFPERIAALLAARPELQPVEDFLAQYVF